MDVNKNLFLYLNLGKKGLFFIIESPPEIIWVTFCNICKHIEYKMKPYPSDLCHMSNEATTMKYSLEKIQTTGAAWTLRAASHYTVSVVRRIRLDAICYDGSSQVTVANDWHRDPCDAPSHTTRLISHDCVISQFTAMSQIFLYMFKSLRRPAIPSDC